MTTARPLSPDRNRWPTGMVKVSELWENEQSLRAHVEAGIVEPLAPRVFRTHAQAIGGSGSQVSLFVDHALRLQLSNWVLPEDARLHFIVDQPLLVLRASLTSDTAYAVPGLPPMLFNRPEIVLTFVPVGAELRMDTAGQQRFHGVLAFFEATSFLSRFGLSEDAVPETLRDALRGTAAAGRLITLPLDARLAQLIALMTDPPRDGRLLELFAVGKLRELVALTLDAAWRTPQFAGSQSARQRDVDLAYAARDVLDREYARPPAVPALAQQLGTNRNKLAAVFRATFRTTMHDYCVERRMLEAQQLLLMAHLSIGEIAEQIGYEHQSSFTAAFRAATGMSPREYQRHRAALDVALAPPPG
ncbi:AraC family transcriptional regulator [Mitsuaria sp. GD03876]|uniref:helix-turn-helix transcriptional regulator n=1 Tax=Mitsuaria sp. GD03876 TaxID=2975399 RepID=UPI00244BFC7A|nr:AraC family transcriptional regulator [Mitsuaria sp. GD03876]MDH0867850.1 AraC family transcriptional regulator [Mitsuaria sp. GD03876]